MVTTERLRMRKAVLVFDPVDRYAADRGLGGPHPRPLGRVTYRLVGRVVGGVRQALDQPYDQPAELAVVTGPSGYSVFFGGVTLPDGRRFQADLPDGQYVVQASSPRYQRSEREDILVPPVPPGLPPPPAPQLAAYRFDLEPGYAYPFPPTSTLGQGRGPTLLRGVVLDAAGDGVEDVTVVVTGRSNTYRTDRTGRFVLTFSDADPGGNLIVRFGFPDGTVRNAAGLALQAGVSNTLAQTALAGRVRAGAVAAARATVEVVGRPGRTTTDPDGRWRYYLAVDQPAGQVDVRATLPDGRTTVQAGVPVQPQRTSPGPVFQFP
jgi:hypothetical protein